MNIFSKLFRRKNVTNISETRSLYSEEVDSNDIPLLDGVPDVELRRLNGLLPWAAFINDAKGRMFGKPYSYEKRNLPQKIPDRRISDLHARVDLQGKTILEAGCFEGIHTVGLAQLGGLVSAFDGRIENVVKTMVRCGFLDVQAKIFYWNLEESAPEHVASSYEVLHHVGVLYHLADPIGHLDFLLDRVTDVVWLDTHVARGGDLQHATHDNFNYRYENFSESGREPPFAGLTEMAKWIHAEDLEGFLVYKGFEVEILEKRDERNGPRVLMCGRKI